MKRRYWKFALLLVLPLALYGYIAERNAWRPYSIELGGIGITRLFFSADGRFLVINHSPAPLAGSATGSDVFVFDREARYSTKRIANAAGLFVMGQDNLVISRSGTEVYSLRNGTLRARHLNYFHAYAALPDGKTLLGIDDSPIVSRYALADTELESENSVRSREVVAWDFVRQPLRTQATFSQIMRSQTKNANATRRKPFTFLPPALSPHMPGQYRSQVCLADLQTLLLTNYLQIKNSPTRTKVVTQLWSIPRQKMLLQSSAIHHANDSSPAPFASTAQGLFALQEGKQLKIWNYKTGKLQAAFPLVPPGTGGNGYIVSAFAIALSPDGSLLANSLHDNAIGLWDTKNGRLLRSLKGHKASLTALTFSPDGTTLASGSSDGTVKLWRIK